MGQTALIPAWVAAAAREVQDCHWIAAAFAAETAPGSRFAQIAATLDWATTGVPTREQAEDMLMASDGGAYDTIVWLLGHKTAPVTLPRRHADGTVMTADDLYAETTAARWGEPEQKAAARRKATKDAALYRQLADLVPH